MSVIQTSRVVNELLTRMGAGADPDHMAALFSDDLDFAVPGDADAFPWIGRKIGRAAAADFFRGVRRLLVQVKFDVQHVLIDDGHAAIIGALASQVVATGRTIESEFVLALTISGGEITRFRMLEDSFAVSLAAKGTVH